MAEPDGPVSRRVRSLAVPAALFVTLGLVLQVRAAAHVTGLTLVQLLALALAACGLVSMRRTKSRALAGGVTALALLAAVVPEIPLQYSNLSRVATDVLTAVHVLGAMVWVGGLVVLAATAIAMRRNMTCDQDEERIAADWARVWERFSLVAMIAVGALIVSGSWLAWSHVGTPGQLLTTAYGRALAIKLALVVALLCAGTYNVRVLLPRIRALQRDGDHRSVFQIAAQHFPTVILGEALVAVGVLIIVPFLRGSARAQAGGPNAAPFDLSTFGIGVVLIAIVAVAMWAGSRRSLRPLQPSALTP
ncbi:copper resistance D family protein [Mycobacterium sp. EPa45]|uniref:copper resistance D family protein n=1 Tax=Mycobacterium sp. EPa45 TaxID=1545728 RepID=UPI0011873041|nr:CopD family protein [Mycobacterium sp. EPa45]